MEMGTGEQERKEAFRRHDWVFAVLGAQLGGMDERAAGVVGELRHRRNISLLWGKLKKYRKLRSWREIRLGP